ncbi:Modification methylase NgoMIV [Cercospora beticola]|uniref:DNA (cytosine-5-)-methyltransferase n=1 Tax=Cercospora beticola TaxID=122368 RepID=A0A2G5IAP5_CERBT|nr:Modification methylase NgoMIV [Cercospora beticola]PIB01614.1 Modification methylase NgoMIV [Cercospora beticola]WPA96720.1 hypothetical protein RHO25_001328 [Cercospora beticola]
MSPGPIMLDDSDDELVVISSSKKTNSHSASTEGAPRFQPHLSPDAHSTQRGTKNSKSPVHDDYGVIVIDSDDDENLEENVTAEALATVQRVATPPGHELLDFAETRYDQIIGSGVSVALDDGSFMRIAVVVRDSTAPHNILVGGNMLQRHGHIDRRINRHGWELHSWLPRRKNELCAIVRMTNNGEVPKLGESLIFRPLGQVGLVRDVQYTNTPWDETASKFQKYEYRCERHTRGLISAEDQSCLECVENREANGPLTCRWKFIEEVDLQRNKIVGWQFRQLERDECDPGHGLNPVSKLATFRGLGLQRHEVFANSDPGLNFGHGAPKRKADPESSQRSSGAGPKRPKRLVDGMVDLTLSESELGTVTGADRARDAVERITVTNPETGEVEEFVFKATEDLPSQSSSRWKGEGNATVPTSSARRHHKTTYTFADICAGGGGTSRGAELAGLKLEYLVDNMPDACQTLRLNFGGDVVLEIDMTDFVQIDGSYRVDVMHVSFPCQGHSRANRGLNPEKDAVNIALSYGTFGKLLQMCKPRLVTMEQVTGILSKDDGQHLRSQIHTLIANDYNVRWQSHVLRDYGNPQGRHRLIVIASCPGQALPDWPERTHGPGLKPFVTIRNILDQVQRPGHNREVMQHAVTREPGERAPYNPNVQLIGCITSSGGYRRDKHSNNYHPSGTRDFTFQEKAQLQGFPWYHSFCGGKQMVGLQIGNAVPPVFAEKLFRSCIKALKKTDKLVEEYLTPIDID